MSYSLTIFHHDVPKKFCLIIFSMSPFRFYFLHLFLSYSIDISIENILTSCRHYFRQVFSSYRVKKLAHISDKCARFFFNIQLQNYKYTHKNNSNNKRLEICIFTNVLFILKYQNWSRICIEFYSINTIQKSWISWK